MKDIIFSDNFIFTHFLFEKYNYTDNRAGSPRHYLAFMEQGTCRIVTKNTTLEIAPGDVFYIPKGLSYQSYWYSDTEIRFISLGFHFFPENGSRQYLLQKINCGEAVKAQVKNIPTGEAIGSLHIGAFYSALAAVLPLMEYEPLQPQKTVIERAKQYISGNISCSAADIARHCMLSQSALYGIFKKYAGITPNELKQKILCEKAVILLTTTDAPVQEISDRLGFSSTSYFRKVLHRHTGKTPREIRKEAKGI